MTAAGPQGTLLYEYSPPRAHPILYAGIMVFGLVFVTGSLENLVRGAEADIFLWYAAPLAATLGLFWALAPSTTRIYEGGIAPARPRILRWLRVRPTFVPWSDLAAVYPSFYDVTGAFVSPFASSDGKVTQMGLGLEWPDGRRETVRFTPTRFTMWRSRSKGYEGALAAVRVAFGDRPLVPAATRFSDAEAKRMLAEASKPFLPFFAIIFLFASAAPVLFLLVNLTSLPVWAALLLSLVAPVAVSARSWQRSRQRHAVLDRLSKAAEFQRTASQGGAP